MVTGFSAARVAEAKLSDANKTKVSPHFIQVFPMLVRKRNGKVVLIVVFDMLATFVGVIEANIENI